MAGLASRRQEPAGKLLSSGSSGSQPVSSSMVRETLTTLGRPMGHQVTGQGRGCSTGVPVSLDQLVSMRLQEQASKCVLHIGTDVALRDAPEPGIHD